MNNKHKLMAGGAIIALLVVLVVVTQKSKVPEHTNGSDIATTPQANYWTAWFATQPVVTPPTSAVTEVLVPPPQLPVTTDTTQKPKKFWITSDITLLQGEGFFYVEDGVLYRTKLKDGVAVERGQKVGEGVEWISGQSEKLTLFTKRAENSDSRWDNELWSIDKELGTARKIYEDVVYSQISPQGDTLAVSTENSELHLINKNGGLLNKVGIHSTSATFSPDGKKLAYHKLADSSSQGDTEELYRKSYGIAVYDINTGKEFLATNSPQDSRPVGLSLDGKYLYFISERGMNLSLWSKNTVGKGEPVQLTSSSAPVYVNYYDAIWSSDKQSVISKTDGEVSLIHIAIDQKSATVHILGQGSSPRWKVQNKAVEFKGKDGEWKTVDVSALVSK